MNASERRFARVMANRGFPVTWPAPRYKLLSLGTTYWPDFRSVDGLTLYEVVGSSGAYAHNRRKYAAFRDEYPALLLSLVTPRGDTYVPTESIPAVVVPLGGKHPGAQFLGAKGGRKAWKGLSAAERGDIIRDRWATRRTAMETTGASGKRPRAKK